MVELVVMVIVVKTDYCLDDLTIWVRFPVGAESFSLRHFFQNGSGANPAS
jgi:hypothetical protein